MKRKGVSPFISHIIAIAVLFVAMTIIAAQMYGYYYTIKEKSLEVQSKALSQKIADSVLNLYTKYKDSDYKPEVGENKTLSEIYITLPEKISGNSYRVSLQSHSKFWIDSEVSIESLQDSFSESFYQNERSYASVKIEVSGKLSYVSAYPIYNIVDVSLEGDVRKATKMKLSYVRENVDGEIRNKIIAERAE